MIDIHCHTAGIGAGEAAVSSREDCDGASDTVSILKAFGVTEQELLAEGDGLIIQRISQTLARSQRVSAAVIWPWTDGGQRRRTG